jgi:hypothetical protein
VQWLTVRSVVKCDHDGRVTNQASQSWVTIDSVPVLVDADPEGREIVACPNYGPTVKPCAKTLKVGVGYSGLVRIDGHRTVLSNLKGLTDGTPPGLVTYTVRDPAQVYVGAET